MIKHFKNLSGKVDEEKLAQLKEEPLEKGDLPAMLLAAFLTLILPATLILLAMVGFSLLVFHLI